MEARLSLAVLATVALALPLAAHGASPPGPVETTSPIVHGLGTGEPPAVGAVVVPSVRFPSAKLCTGTLVGCRTVLTSARCFCSDFPASQCDAPPNVSVWFQHAPRAAASEVLIHPDWDPEGKRHDLAIVRLDEPVDGIAPPPVNATAPVPPGTGGELVGFGATAAGERDLGIKRTGRLTTVPCATDAPELHVCWDFEEPSGVAGEDVTTCGGDEGAPLLVRDGSGDPVVAGVATRPRCEAPHQGVAADVLADRAWIEANAGPDLGAASCGPLPAAGTEAAPILPQEGVVEAEGEDVWQFEVEPGTRLLRAGLNAEDPLGTGSDVSLEVGREGDPGAGCASQQVGSGLELCEVDDPPAGMWFARVTNPLEATGYQLTLTRFGNRVDVPPEPCEPGPTTLCLADERFAVEVDWATPQGDSGEGQAEPLTADTGYFWFFDEANVEVVVKVLDTCSFTDSFWVFAGGLTDVGVELTVTDTEAGVERTYRNPQRTAFQPIQDTQAFETCP